MIERQIVAEKIREKDVENYILSFLGKLSCSKVKIQRVPLGDKVSVFTSRPGMVVGRKGSNIHALTSVLKNKFKMENPQIEVVEIENPDLDSATIAKYIVNTLERFGPKRFKAVAYRVIANTIKAGARGVEVVIGGRGVPSERARSWRFTAGYLKKSGDISASYIDRHNEACNLKSGTIGVKVSVLRPDVILPDDIKIKAEEIDNTIQVEQIDAIETLKEVAKTKEEKSKKSVLEKIPAKEKKVVKKKVKLDGESK